MSNQRKKILVICPYPQNCAPSQRLKFEQYYSIFREHGFDVKVSSFVVPAFWKILYQKGYFWQKIIFTLYGYCKRIIDLFRLPFYDIVYIHLWVTPFGPPVFEWLYRKMATKIVYDIDDMIFLGHVSDANKKVKHLKGTQKMISLMKSANHVITCTPALDNFVKKYNSFTTDISSTINTEVYKEKQSYELSSPIIIGWSGSHSTSSYLKILEPVFNNLLEKQLNFKVLVIGDKNFSFENANIPLEAKEWNLTDEVKELSRFDIGVYPLPDEPWVYGKSGLKALQYMAIGIPTIATAIGANFRIIEHGVNGFLIKDNNIGDWVNTILHLCSDIQLRKTIGKNARIKVIQEFSVQSNAAKYLTVLNSL
ncbi:MAG: glycosyltransferase family 4 protein [Bacteroidales bacterium]|nr:glycosyltransferase family 4 protein [Bacteroidales bacterium]